MRHRGKPLSPRAAFSAVQHAANNLEGAAIVASAAVEGIGRTAMEREAARYTADRLLQADVAALREAMGNMERTLQGGAP